MKFLNGVVIESNGVFDSSFVFVVCSHGIVVVFFTGVVVVSTVFFFISLPVVVMVSILFSIFALQLK